MSEMEIALAKAYLAAARQDPVAALIRSVRDLVRQGATARASAPRAGDGGERASAPAA